MERLVEAVEMLVSWKGLCRPGRVLVEAVIMLVQAAKMLAEALSACRGRGKVV